MPHTASRGSGGRKALATTTRIETAINASQAPVIARNSGRSRRRTDSHSQPATARNTAYVIANAPPSSVAAPAVKTARSARIAIWTNTNIRVRPSCRPCSSTYSEPLVQAIQTMPKTIANSRMPRPVMSSASACDAWPMTAT